MLFAIRRDLRRPESSRHYCDRHQWFGASQQPYWPYGNVAMKKVAASIVLAFAFCLSASADVWKWVDVSGKTHYVDTKTAIYTWVDEYGKTHYSDKPEHESAVSVELMWHSTGDLPDASASVSKASTRRARKIDPNETELDRYERESAEAYFCKRAREIYDSYLSAPRLYKTNEDGEKEYLSDEESATTIADTETKVAALCN